jgi:hypothetical protein
MRKRIGMFLGLSVAAVLPASAATNLKLQCVARDLTPGAHVWVEVRPEYHQTAMAQGGQDSGVLQEAKGDSVWQFDVPASGQVVPISHDFTFPVDLDRTSSDPVGFIKLETRFKVDHPAGQDKVGYDRRCQLTMHSALASSPQSISRPSYCLRGRSATVSGTAFHLASSSRCQSRCQIGPPRPRAAM